MKNKPLVSVIMGSDSDYETMKAAVQVLKDFEVPFEKRVVSAHRTPDLLYEFAGELVDRGIKVVIAGAGGAAHLPGMVASITPIPVIGVPVPGGHLEGVDALYSIVQMPRGVPVATVAVGNSYNAGLLAVQILSTDSKEGRGYQKALIKYKKKLNQMVRKKKLPK